MSPEYISDQLRAEVFKLDGGVCVYCGRRGNCIDHYIPSSRHGPSVLDNLYTCCRSCNSIKGDRPIYEVDLALRFGRFAYQVRPTITPSQIAPPIDNDDPNYWTTDQVIEYSAHERRPDGRYRFTAAKIARLTGVDHATVLAKMEGFRDGTLGDWSAISAKIDRIDALQSGEPPAQFRQEDGDTAPAHYPVTNKEQP
jgi:hypothetical protein